MQLNLRPLLDSPKKTLNISINNFSSKDVVSFKILSVLSKTNPSKIESSKLVLTFSKMPSQFNPVPFSYNDNNSRVKLSGQPDYYLSTDKETSKNKFTDLFFVLEKIIKEEELLSSDFNLNEISKTMLIAIILKKLKQPKLKEVVTNAVMNKDQDAVRELNKRIRSFKPQKRAEERYKFIFKMTLNSFRERFFKNNGLKKKDSASELKFWDFHFQQFCQDNQIPISSLYDPLNSKLAVNDKFKCLNAEYFELIFKNERFKTIFFKYIENHLKEDYFSKIQHKLQKMFIYLDEQLSQKQNSVTEIVDKFIKTKINSRGCKLPWSACEIDHARHYFMQYIGKLTRK